MTTYRTTFCDDAIEFSANFAQASCPIPGDSSGRQVADFRHSPRAAMRAQLEQLARDSGEDPVDCEDEIEAALDRMTETDE